MSLAPAYAAGSGNRTEFETPWLGLAQNPLPLSGAFASRSWDGQSDAGDLVATNAEPFLRVSQVTNAPLVANGTGTSLAQIMLLAVNGTVTIQAVNVTFEGTFDSGSISAVDLADASSCILSTQPIAPFVHFSFPPFFIMLGDTLTFSLITHILSTS